MEYSGPVSIAGVVLQTLIQEAMVHQATERHLTSLAGGQQDRRRKMAAHIQTAAAVGPSSGGIRGRTATADPFGAEAAGAQFAPRLGLQRALASKLRFVGYAEPTAEENGGLHGSNEAERNALTATKLRLEREVAALKQQTERSDLRR